MVLYLGRNQEVKYRRGAAAGTSELLMDGRFAAALRDVSLQLIIQRFSLLSSSTSFASVQPPPLHLLLSSHPLHLSFHSLPVSLFHPDFCRWDSNWTLFDHCPALSVNIARYISLISILCLLSVVCICSLLGSSAALSLSLILFKSS